MLRQPPSINLFPYTTLFRSNCKGVDIANTAPFKFQCKNNQNYKSVGTIKEIIKESENDIPVLVTKGVRQEPMAVLPFEKFVTLLEVVYGLVPHWGEHKDLVEIGIDVIQSPEPRLISSEDISANGDTTLLEQFI